MVSQMPATPMLAFTNIQLQRSSISVKDLLCDSPKLLSSPTQPRCLRPSIPIAKSPSHAMRRRLYTRGPWRFDEDKKLKQLVGRFGAHNWSQIADYLPLRNGKQARERWVNQLDPSLKKKNWTPAEDRIIIEAHRKTGNRWSCIAQMLPGRTDNSVKNRFNSTITRAIRKHERNSSRFDIDEIVSSIHVFPYADQHNTLDYPSFPSCRTVKSACYNNLSFNRRDM